METFGVSGSFVARAVGRAPDTEGCFRVAVWQVFASSWVSKWELVVGRQLSRQPFDFHSLATCRDPSDEAFEPGCDLVESDGSLDLLAEIP